MYYINNLYQEVFRRNAKSSVELNIIAGYASSNLLQQFHEEFPNLRINLYIGMALEGISHKDHLRYIELVKDSQRSLNIFYKNEYPLNHIKLYDFELQNKQHIVFIGSANFSDAGLKYNQEILTETSDDFASLFRDIHNSSISCDNDDVEKYIRFYLEEEESIDVVKEPEEINDVHHTSPTIMEEPMTHIPYKKRMIRRSNRASEVDFRIPIILDNDFSPDNRGVNAWVRDKYPYLTQSNSFPFSKTFPLDQEFIIITDTGEKFHGWLNSINDNQMYISPSIYEYLRRILNINERRPINLNDLRKHYITEIWGDRIDDGVYLFDFSPKRVDRRNIDA